MNSEEKGEDLEPQAEEVSGEIPVEDLPNTEPVPPPPPPDGPPPEPKPEEADYDVIATQEIDGLTYDLVVMRGSGQPVKEGIMETMIMSPQVRITKAGGDGETESEAA